MCPDLPDPVNGDIVFEDDLTAPFDLGTLAKYTCSPGFVPFGDSTVRVCLNAGVEEGEWDGTSSSCERECFCPNPKVLISLCCIDLHVTHHHDLVV